MNFLFGVMLHCCSNVYSAVVRYGSDLFQPKISAYSPHYGLRNVGIVFRFYTIATGPVVEFTQFSVGWLQGCFSRGYKRPGRELEHTLPYSA